jgi:hypothetical protein
MVNAVFLKYFPDLREFFLSCLDLYVSGSFLEKILIIEASIFISFIFLLISYHEMVQRSLNKRLNAQEKIKKYLIDKISTKQELGLGFFNKKFRSLQLLAPVLEKINHENIRDEHWIYLRDELLESCLLPIARKQAQSFSWTKRYWSLRCLSIAPRRIDEHYFLKSLLDPVAHNRFAAIKPLLDVKSSTCADSIVKAMTGENRHTQAVYISMMKFGEDRFFDAIRNRLENEMDIDSRRVCIDIMSESLSKSDIFLIKKDINSPDKYLKLTSIRCLNKFKMDHATQLLIGFLEAEEWEVRAISAQFLGDRNAIKAVPKLIENAGDKNWWVRMNSIMALKKMGGTGEAALLTINPTTDKYAFEMINYLNTVDQESALQQSNILILKKKAS